MVFENCTKNLYFWINDKESEFWNLILTLNEVILLNNNDDSIKIQKDKDFNRQSAENNSLIEYVANKTENKIKINKLLNYLASLFNTSMSIKMFEKSILIKF